MNKSDLSPWILTAEEKIKDAMDAGEFNNLPGRGKPLDLEEDAHVPFELRMMYRMLKRANVPPEEVFIMRECSILRSRLLNNPNLPIEEKIRLKKRLQTIDLEFNMRLERFRRLYRGL